MPRRPRWAPSPLLGYKFAAAVAGHAPDRVARVGARAVGRVLRRTMRGRRATVARHLQRVDPTLVGPALEHAVEAAFDSYARYYVDSFRLPSLDAAAVDAGFTVEGYENIPAGLAAGNGVILALPHLGGWEWAGRWVTDRGDPMTVVVEPLEPPEVFEWFVSFRRSLGMTVVPLGPGAAAACLRALNQNEVLCLLCDRDLDRDGVEVEFFGERTTLPAGPAILALRTGAPLVPSAVYFRGAVQHGVCGPPLPVARQGRLRDDVARVTQDLARVLEVLIRAAPEQWHLFQPNWPSDTGNHRIERARSAGPAAGGGSDAG
jgi:lauroyl/myristoyl acyltransferase